MDIIKHTFTSKRSGDFVVLEKSKHPMQGKHYLYRVQFLNTGNCCWAHKTNILAKSIFDKDAQPAHPFVGEIIKSNSYGYFRVNKQIPTPYKTLFEIVFLLTGYTTTVQSGAIQYGEIRDPFYPIKYGVACMGMANKHNFLYSRWCDMISRCYNPNDIAYQRYGGSGISVCNDWLCLEKFINSVVSLPGYNKELIVSGKLQLDKDKSGSNIYSPQTCEWLTCKENQQYRRPRNSCVAMS